VNLVEWISFTTGALTTLFAFAIFSQDKEEFKTEEEGLTVHTTSGRLVEMSCQTCRKLKRHREIETDLYECTKCKRRIDLRKVS
jgi:hypothetical protein